MEYPHVRRFVKQFLFTLSGASTMFICNLAYRHINGDVEGFSACALTSKARAEEICIESMQRKTEDIGQVFSALRVIRSSKGLTREEITTIKADWSGYRLPAVSSGPRCEDSTYPGCT